MATHDHDTPLFCQLCGTFRYIWRTFFFVYLRDPHVGNSAPSMMPAVLFLFSCPVFFRFGICPISSCSAACRLDSPPKSTPCVCTPSSSYDEQYLIRNWYVSLHTCTCFNFHFVLLAGALRFYFSPQLSFHSRLLGVL